MVLFQVIMIALSFLSLLVISILLGIEIYKEYKDDLEADKELNDNVKGDSE